MLGQEMSKAVLGHIETQGSSLSGQSDAKVKDGVRKDLRETRARVIAADLTRDLLGPMIRLNFGDSVEVPRFEFVTADAPDLLAFSGAMKNLRDAGLAIPQAWVRNECGIPEPKDGEPVLDGATAPPAAQDPKVTDEKPEPDKPEGDDEPPIEEPDEDEAPPAAVDEA